MPWAVPDALIQAFGSDRLDEYGMLCGDRYGCTSDGVTDGLIASDRFRPLAPLPVLQRKVYGFFGVQLPRRRLTDIHRASDVRQSRLPGSRRTDPGGCKPITSGS